MNNIFTSASFVFYLEVELLSRYLHSLIAERVQDMASFHSAVQVPEDMHQLEMNE